MTITKAALLIYLAVTVTQAAETDCRKINCPCGSTGKNVTVCVPKTKISDKVCTRFLKCESCVKRLNVCNTCTKELDGPYCSRVKGISHFRQKRQARYPTRVRPRPNAAALQTCPNLDSPKLGSLRCMASSDLQTCTGKCLPGYHFTTGNEVEMTLTCQRGQWTPRSSFPDCKSAGHCDLVVEGAGSFNCTTGMEGTRCDVRCSGLYPVRVFCYPGRDWEPPLPRCVKPKTVTEGRTSCSCRNGGTCDSSGRCVCTTEWTGANCETAAPNPLVCPDPGQAANANRLNTDGTPSISHTPDHPAYAAGHSVVYTCLAGFALEGQSLIKCMASGRWSGKRPFCRRIQPSIPVTQTPVTRPPSTNQRFCRDPRVDLNGIRDPKTPPDRRGFPPGSRLDYSCELGYDLVGETTLFCLITGMWSANRPRCVLRQTTTEATPLIYCAYPGDVVNGRVVHVPSLNERRRPADETQGEYPEGSRLRYSCEDGYVLEGSPTLTCQNSGSWSAALPRCVPDAVNVVYCVNPGPIPNGQVVYYPNISNRRRPTPQPTELDDPEYPVGGRLQYSCKSGYSLVGSATLVCEESGLWSADVPVCFKDTIFCTHPGKVDNALVMHIPPPNERSRPTDDTNEEYPSESQLQYSCDYGYTLQGPDVLYCQSTGTWNASPPMCISDNPLSCENPGFIMNGRVKYYPPPVNVRIRPEPNPDYDLDEFPERAVLEYSCDDGYRLQGNETLTCLPSGIWSSRIPTCEADCGKSYMQMTTARVRNGSRTVSGEWPWVVSISAEVGGVAPFICGGAILNPHTVITAAHCLVGYRSFILRFGKHHFKVEDDDEEVLQRRSTRVIIHQDYSNTTLDSDIGLIIFRPRIRYSLRLQPICLPNTQTTLRNLVPGKIGYVGGWGETENAVPPDIMMLASLPVVTNKQCMDAYAEQGLVITTNMFCAGYEDARQSVCGGDSGSPFVFYNKRTDRYVLEGLVSFGLRGQCGVAGKYAIFTEVFRFVRWIINNSK